MMKKLMLILSFFVVIAFAGIVSADNQQQNANSLAISETSSNAIAAPYINVLGGGQTISSVKISSEGSKAPPPAPGAISPPVLSPPLFVVRHTHPNEIAVPFILGHLDAFKPVYTREMRNESKIYSGLSGRTTIIFQPNYSGFVDTSSCQNGNKADYSDVDGIGIDDTDFLDDECTEIPHDGKIKSVRPTFNPPKARYRSLGLMTVIANEEDASETPLSTVISDASNFPLDHVVGTGVEHVWVVSIASVIGANYGVTGNGHGFNVSPGLSSILSAATLGTISAGAATSTGRSFPTPQIGATFVILAEDPNGVMIDFTPKPTDTAKHNTGKGGNGVKATASKVLNK